MISGTMRQNDYRCMSRKQAMETIDWGKYKLITLAEQGDIILLSIFHFPPVSPSLSV